VDWKRLYRQRRVEAEEALLQLRSGSRIFLGSGCGAPRHLQRVLASLDDRLHDIEVLQVLSVAQEEFLRLCRSDSLRPTQVFVAASQREEVSLGQTDYTPLKLSDVPELLASGRWAIDAAIIQVSPPDQHGYFSLGVAVDVVTEAVRQARVVIAQVNQFMPRTLGRSFVHLNQITHLVEYDEPLITYHGTEAGELQARVAAHAARLVPDGATIHCGLGVLPQTVLRLLGDKKNLGVHTNALTEAYLDLAEAGVITGAAKTIYPDRMVASLCLGGERLINFVADNPQVELLPVTITNDPAVIGRNHRMTCLHEALEIDLTGQVCGGAIGGRVFAGLGAMHDFSRGAAHSPGGADIVMLTSTRPNGSSRIMASLSPGAEVDMARSEVRTVVTEYGAAHLHGLSLRERALALIDLAHPNHRDGLLTAARQQKLITDSQILTPLFTGIYPAEFERTVKLKDGSEVFIRPVKPTDERLVQQFFYGMSDREVYYRFLHGLKSFPKKDMQMMVNIDYHRQMALLAITGDFESPRVVGVGRYVLGEGEMPEVDFAVSSDFQGKGLGRAIMNALVDIAKQRGLPGVSAVIMSDNLASLHIFYNLGYAVTGTVDRGVTEIQVHFDRPVTEPTVELKYEGKEPRQP